MSSPRWVNADQVVLLNQSILRGSTENHLLRDRGSLESAVARPQNYFSYTGDAGISMLAAEVIFGIGKAHAFEQGNKRTAWAAGRLLARMNGADFVLAHQKKQVVIAVAIERAITEDQNPGMLALYLEDFLTAI